MQVLSWFWPFAATPDRSTGLDFEVNGFEGLFSIHS
jgi:palmitoyltransferase